MQRIISSVIFIIILSAVPALSQERMRIAVMDFEARDLPKNESAKITELIRNELINSGMYTVIERAQMGAILKEQGLQQSGCTDVSCAVEIGKILSARKILVGTIMKLNNDIIITGRVVDIEKGVAEFSEKSAVRQGEDVMKAVEIYVEKLSAKIGNYKIPEKQEKDRKTEGESSTGFTPDFRISAEFNYLTPLGRMCDLISTGPGGTLSGNILYGSFEPGISAGYYYIPGKEKTTESLALVPLLLTAGYRIGIMQNLYITPAVSGGGVYVSLSQDPDGTIGGDDVSYKTKSSMESMTKAGARIGYGLTAGSDLYLGADYSMIYEKDGILRFFTINAGFGLKF